MHRQQHHRDYSRDLLLCLTPEPTRPSMEALAMISSGKKMKVQRLTWLLGRGSEHAPAQTLLAAPILALVQPQRRTQAPHRRPPQPPLPRLKAPGRVPASAIHPAWWHACRGGSRAGWRQGRRVDGVVGWGALAGGQEAAGLWGY